MVEFVETDARSPTARGQLYGDRFRPDEIGKLLNSIARAAFNRDFEI